MGKKLFANLLDEMIVFGVSVIVLFLFQGIIKLMGYQFKAGGSGSFLAIFLFIFNVLYFPIIENSKYGSTFGKRIMKLDEETAALNEAEKNKKEECKENNKEEVKTEETVEEVKAEEVTEEKTEDKEENN